MTPSHKPIKWFALCVYGIVTAVVIYVLSLEPYEWMVGEKSDDGLLVTLCTLPDSQNSDGDVSALCILVLISLSLLPGGIGAVKHKRWNPLLIMGMVLVLFAAYRFFGQSLAC